MAGLRVGDYLSNSRLEEQAEATFRTVLDILNELSGDNTAAMLDGREGLAYVLRDRSILDPVKLDEAERELRVVCAEREFMLERAGGMPRQLAQVGWRTPEGLILLEQNWEPTVAKPVLDMLQSYQHLAIALAYQDQNSSEAKTIYQMIYEAQKRLLGENHRDTLASRTGLAARLYYEKRFEEAESEFRKIFEAEQQLPELGPEHPDTIQDRSWLAATLQAQSRLEDAEYEWREVCAARQRVLGPEHSETLDARAELAGLLFERGRLQDAERELRDIYNVRQRVLGPEHPRTIAVRVELANMFEVQGRLEDAERELRGIYMVRYRSLGPKHDDTLEARLRLATVLVNSGRQLMELVMQSPTTTEGASTMTIGDDGKDAIGQAVAHFQEALTLVDRDNEPGFYGVILHDLAAAARVSGDLQRAVSEYREAIAYKSRRVPSDPADLAITMESYSDALIESGDLMEARNVLVQLKELLPQIEDRARRAVRLHTLGRGFEVLGDEGQEDGYDEALNAYKGALDLVDADADPGSYATVLKDLGDVYKTRDKMQAAYTHYSLAVEYMRRLPEEKRRLASMLRDLGLMELRIANVAETIDKGETGDKLPDLTGTNE